MKKLTIKESLWANPSDVGHGESMLLNDKGCMCCLGFLACMTMGAELPDLTLEQRHNIEGLATPASTSEVKWPKEVIEDYMNSNWTADAIAINDNHGLTFRQRQNLLIEHFKLIGIELAFVP